MSQRVVKGILYAHGRHVFAFLNTKQPYNITECGDLSRRANKYSSSQVGTITVRLVEDEHFPEMQGFAVLTDHQDVNRSRFETLVMYLFPECTLETRWVTNFAQEDNLLFLGLIARQILQRT